MTFSIVGRCSDTGQLGIAISSSSIAVGARCPWLRAGVGAVASQNVTLPAKPRKGAREDILEPIIIAARGQRRWIKRQRDGGPRWAFNTRSEAYQ